MTDVLALASLQAENARLIALLEAHSIEWRLPQFVPAVAQEPEPSRLSTSDKVALFRRLFRGRTDVYPIRWEGKTSGKSGYAPACANEWRAGFCDKPRIKCGDCSNRVLIPLSDAPMARSNSPTLGHPKFPQAGRSDYDDSGVMAMRAAASLRR